MWRQNLPHSASTCQQKKGNRIKTGLKKTWIWKCYSITSASLCIVCLGLFCVSGSSLQNLFPLEIPRCISPCKDGLVWKLRPEERAGCDIATPTEDWNMAFFWPEFCIFPQKYFLQEQRAETSLQTSLNADSDRVKLLYRATLELRKRRAIQQLCIGINRA